MASSLITSRQIEVEKMAGVTDLLFLGSKTSGCGYYLITKPEDDCFSAGKLWQT